MSRRAEIDHVVRVLHLRRHRLLKKRRDLDARHAAAEPALEGALARVNTEIDVLELEERELILRGVR